MEKKLVAKGAIIGCGQGSRAVKAALDMADKMDRLPPVKMGMLTGFSNSVVSNFLTDFHLSNFHTKEDVIEVTSMETALQYKKNKKSFHEGIRKMI